MFNKGKVALYIDGSIDNQTIFDDAKDCVLNATEAFLQVGGSPWYGGYSNCDMGMLEIYPRELSGEEIKVGYEREKGKYVDK